MANKDLSLKPHTAKVQDDRATAWWYEENGGIAVLVQPNGYARPLTFEIPWRTLRTALRRKDAAPGGEVE